MQRTGRLTDKSGATRAGAPHTTDHEPAVNTQDIGRVGHAHADQLEDVPRRLYALDYQYGGDSLCDQAIGELFRARLLLHRGTYSESVGRRLERAIGELAICAGWLAFDAGRQGHARYCYSEALAMARSTDDAELEVHVLANMSMQAVALERPRDGLRLAEAARRTANGWATPTVRSLLAMREAKAWARLREPRQADRSMSEAWALLHRSSTGEEKPVWIAFFDGAELSGMDGVCQLDLGDSSRAVKLLEQACAAQQGGFVRNRSFYQVWLAASHLARRDVEVACRLADEALPVVADEVTSTRTLNELRRFRRRLRRFHRQGVARDFMARFDSVFLG